jgi:hypothetical protein
MQTIRTVCSVQPARVQLELRQRQNFVGGPSARNLVRSVYVGRWADGVLLPQT